MGHFERSWLLINSASGSNTPAAVAAVRSALAEAGLAPERVIDFPDDPLPDPDMLEEAGDPLLVLFGGDGTVNSALRELDGWGGAALVLPGGTMNLLAKRLHGDASVEEIVGLVARGGALQRRPHVIACSQGIAFAGLLVGPGTRWANVREAMRDFDVPAMLEGASDAMGEMTGTALVCARDPELGCAEGYPLVELTPGEHGIRIDGYRAESAGEYIEHGWALLRRSFREGPHDRLGVVGKLSLESVDGTPLEILIDGEPAQSEPHATFEVAPSPVDLLATCHGH